MPIPTTIVAAVGDEPRDTAVASDIAGAAIEDDFEYDVAAFVGEPVEALTTFAGEHDVEYLVIGGRKRSPIGKLVFGARPSRSC